MAVASMHLGVWSWSRQSLKLQSECQNGRKRRPVCYKNYQPVSVTQNISY